MSGRAWLLAPLVTGTITGCVGRPNANYRSTYTDTDSGDVETRTWTHRAELGIQDTIGPDFEYRLGERLVRSDTQSGGLLGDTSNRLTQTTVDTAITAGTMLWTQGFDLQRNRLLLDEGPDNDLVRTNILEKIEWAPIDLPRVTAWIDFRDSEDDLFVDQDSTDVVVEIEQTRGAFDYFYSYEDEELNDSLADVDRDRDEQIFRGTYRDNYLDGDLSTTVSVFSNDRHQTTHFPDGTTPTIQVPTIAGLSVIDTTPQVSVLQNTPGLIDGDDTTSTGLNIGSFGSGGELNWNIGVEVPLNSTVDLVHLFTVDPVNLNVVDDFAFSVWSSDDNNFWSLVTASAAFDYNPTLRRFRITMPTVSGRFLKVVNTAAPAASLAVFVSEMEVLVEGPADGSSKTTVDERTRNLTWNLSWWVNDDLRIDSDLLLQSVDRESDGVTTRDENRVDTGIAAFWAAHEIVDVALRVHNQRTDDSATVDQETTVLSDLITIRALETLELTLGYTQSDRDIDGEDDLDTRATRAGATAQLLDSLQAEISAEYNSQDDTPNEIDIDRLILAGSLNAELSPEVSVSLGIRNETADVSGAGADVVPDPAQQRYELVVLYEPSPQFTAEAQLDWVDDFTGSGLDQRLRLDWIPFPDGAVDIQLDADRLEAGNTGAAIDRYQILTRWNFNPNAFLELNYSAQIPEDDDRTDVIAVSFNITM